MKKPVPFHSDCRGFAQVLAGLFMLFLLYLFVKLLDWLQRVTQIENLWVLLALGVAVVVAAMLGLKGLLVWRDRVELRQQAERVARWHAAQAAMAKQAEPPAAAASSVPQPAAQQPPRHRTAEDLKRFDE